jgi:eukaryotic-like serine/threonine-protein kinase
MAEFELHRWREISPLLDHALGLKSEELTVWLQALRKSQAALAAEVEAALQEHQQADDEGFLAERLETYLTPPVGAGLVIGAYTLETLLGAGGMGQVWRARRSDGSFQGVVAIKILTMSLAGRQGQARFRHEAGVLAKLTHPGIARLVDAGVSDSGQAYLILEYVSGIRIDRYCNSKHLDVRARIRLFLDVMAAVAHAHTNLIVHRDIKPPNILVSHDGQVKLLDFGIAKLLEADAAGAPFLLTREGEQALTPEFAAPEQITGGPVTTATDVYSLGVLLYLLLSGEHPTLREGKAPTDYLKYLTQTEPMRLSNVAPVDRDLDLILFKALKKDPNERYGSIAAFAGDLQRYLSHQPISVRPDSWSYRAGKLVRRYRGASIAALVAVLAILLGALGTATQAQRAGHERDRAFRDLTYAEATNDFMGFLLSEGASGPITTTELLSRAEMSVQKQFAAEPALRARMQWVIARQYLSIRDSVQAERLLLVARGTAAGVGDASLQTDIDCDLAATYDSNGNGASATQLYQTIEQGPLTNSVLEPSTAASCHARLAQFYRDRGDAVRAVANGKEALSLLGTPRPGQRILALDFREVLAGAYGISGQRAEAVRTYEALFADLQRMGRENTSATMVLAVNYAVNLTRAGQAQRAAEVYERTVNSSAAQGRLADRNLESNYAGVLVSLGRAPEAVALIERALAAAAEAKNARTIAHDDLVAANVWCAVGELERCESYLNKARGEFPAIYPANHRNYATLEWVSAHLAQARQDVPGAREHLRRALEIFAHSAESEPTRIRVLAELVRADLKLGELQEAQQNSNRALKEARENSQGFQHTEWLGTALLVAGLVKRAQGANTAAAADWREALSHLTEALGPNAPLTVEARTALSQPTG